MKKKTKKRQRKHGFISRAKTKGGRAVLARRRSRGGKGWRYSAVIVGVFYETIIKKKGGGKCIEGRKTAGLKHSKIDIQGLF